MLNRCTWESKWLLHYACNEHCTYSNNLVGYVIYGVRKAWLALLVCIIRADTEAKPRDHSMVRAMGELNRQTKQRAIEENRKICVTENGFQACSKANSFGVYFQFGVVFEML